MKTKSIKSNWQSLRTFGSFCLLASITAGPLLGFALWQPAAFDALYHATTTYQNTLLVLRWALIGALWWYWLDIIALLQSRYQWPFTKYVYWQYKRHRFTVWLVLFEVLVCENSIPTILHLV